MTLTIHKHLLFILKVGNTYNKCVQNLSKGVQKYFLKKNYSIKLNIYIYIYIYIFTLVLEESFTFVGCGFLISPMYNTSVILLQH